MPAADRVARKSRFDGMPPPESLLHIKGLDGSKGVERSRLVQSPPKVDAAR